MAIGSVRRRGNILEVFDERGRRICYISISSQDQLLGWTSDTVVVRRGRLVYHYDVRCHLRGIRPG